MIKFFSISILPEISFYLDGLTPPLLSMTTITINPSPSINDNNYYHATFPGLTAEIRKSIQTCTSNEHSV